MMDREEAEKWYHSVVVDGSHEEQKEFFDTMGYMDYGIIGEVARKKHMKRDGVFSTGVEFGIMIALDKVFGIK